jgi:hypothetical protein
MVYDFRWFRAQIKSEGMGFSPRDTTGTDGHWKVPRDDKTLAPICGGIASSFQGSADLEKQRNGVTELSSSSTVEGQS